MDNYIGTISGFGFNFAQRGWAMCAGQIQSIAQNPALFALIGTYYGGDGRSTMGLPDLRGRTAIGQGQGPGLSMYHIGLRAGQEREALSHSQLPTHTHTHSYTGAGSVDGGTTVSVAKIHGGHSTPVDGDFIGMTSNGPSTASGGSLYVTPADAATAGTATIGGVVSGGGSGFDSTKLVINNTGSGSAFSILQPFQAITYSIAVQGEFPSRN